MYQIILSLDGENIGDVAPIIQDFSWSVATTAYGVDTINFTINDKLLSDWAEERGLTINDILRPYALEAVVIRNDEKLLGGFLATMPAYQPKNATADLEFRFDGWLNLLAGVYIRPTQEQTLPAGTMVALWIDKAEQRSKDAGKAFGFTRKYISPLNKITRTFDSFKTVKEAITQVCDNVDGAGQFDVIFNYKKEYTITNSLGRDIMDWSLIYPAVAGGDNGIAKISAPEISGFASHIITIGSGETSSDPYKNTAIEKELSDNYAIQEYGYVENLTQYSSISRQTTLDTRCATDLYLASSIQWQPEIELLGVQTPPSPTAHHGLWIGDRIDIRNVADLTGQTSGRFKIVKLEVSVNPTGSEVVKPTLERIG